jgi:hypothetical protein
MSKEKRTFRVPSSEIARASIAAIVLAATMSLLGACKRSAPATGASAAASASAGMPAGGCVDTNPPPQLAGGCAACLEKNAQSSGKDGCCGIADATALRLCEAASKCMRAGGPPVGSCNLAGDTTTCFCGKYQADCDVPGKANGPCVAEITTAAGRNIETATTDTPNAGQILTRYGETKYALGRAANVAAIAGAFCKAECGLGM